MCVPQTKRRIGVCVCVCVFQADSLKRQRGSVSDYLQMCVCVVVLYDSKL